MILLCHSLHNRMVQHLLSTYPQLLMLSYLSPIFAQLPLFAITLVYSMLVAVAVEVFILILFFILSLFSLEHSRHFSQLLTEMHQLYPNLVYSNYLLALWMLSVFFIFRLLLQAPISF